ncbi:hypothetical protein A0J61_05274 [Choanephora cucurbitarum]|uniref:Uncharacterized protein n=1 Tax=Choanephora cucurbitarum TaxID=101091 RepID=A0A1C7NC43_9FUNG|nr:hypothetical protein A0J61_05274 [Choanephora cucurbitarum]
MKSSFLILSAIATAHAALVLPPYPNPYESVRNYGCRHHSSSVEHYTGDYTSYTRTASWYSEHDCSEYASSPPYGYPTPYPYPIPFPGPIIEPIPIDPVIDPVPIDPVIDPIHGGVQPIPDEGVACIALYYPCPELCPDNCVRPTNSPCPFATRPTCPPEVCAAVLCAADPVKPCPADCLYGCDYINQSNPCCDFLGEPVCRGSPTIGIA